MTRLSSIYGQKLWSRIGGAARASSQGLCLSGLEDLEILERYDSSGIAKDGRPLSSLPVLCSTINSVWAR